MRSLVCLQEQKVREVGAGQGGGGGHGHLACYRGAAGSPPRDRGVRVCVLCGPRPSRRLAQSSLLLLPRTLFSPECLPSGCLHLLPLRPISGSPPLGSLPWLPAMPLGRGPFWVELGVGTFPHGARGWVVSPCTVSPLQPRPQHRGAGSLCRTLRWPQSVPGGHPEAQGCSAKVDGLGHRLGPKGVLFELELGQDP